MDILNELFLFKKHNFYIVSTKQNLKIIPKNIMFVYNSPKQASIRSLETRLGYECNENDTEIIISKRNLQRLSSTRISLYKIKPAKDAQIKTTKYYSENVNRKEFDVIEETKYKSLKDLITSHNIKINCFDNNSIDKGCQRAKAVLQKLLNSSEYDFLKNKLHFKSNSEIKEDIESGAKSVPIMRWSLHDIVKNPREDHDSPDIKKFFKLYNKLCSDASKELKDYKIHDGDGDWDDGVMEIMQESLVVELDNLVESITEI